MPYSDSFSNSFRHEPLSLAEVTEMTNEKLGEWTVGEKVEEFKAIWPLG